MGTAALSPTTVAVNVTVPPGPTLAVAGWSCTPTHIPVVGSQTWRGQAAPPHAGGVGRAIKCATTSQVITPRTVSRDAQPVVGLVPACAHAYTSGASHVVAWGDVK